MENDKIIIALTKQDRIWIEMIIVDNDKDQSLVFLKELHNRIETSSRKGMKSHLDG